MQNNIVQNRPIGRKRHIFSNKTNSQHVLIELNFKNSPQPAKESVAIIKAPDGTEYIIPDFQDNPAEFTMLASAGIFLDVFDS